MKKILTHALFLPIHSLMKMSFNGLCSRFMTLRFSVIFLIIVCFSIGSCAVLKNTPGFYTGFDKLSVDQQNEICFIDSVQQLDSCDCKYKAITGHHVYEMLPENDTTLLIFWRPECASDACLPLSTIVDFCTATNYKFIIVPDYYDVLLNPQIDTYNGELFFTNHKYYDSNYNPKVIDQFINDIGLHFNVAYDDLIGHRFSFFVGNKQLHTFEYLEELEKGLQMDK